MASISQDFVLERIREKRAALGITDVYKRSNWSKNELSYQRWQNGNVTRKEIWLPLLDEDGNEIW